MRSSIIPRLFFIILSYFLLSTYSYASKIKSFDAQDIPSEVSFFNEKGEKCFLDQFEGKTILLSFWASWCTSCSKEIPQLDDLQKDFKKLPLVIVAVSQDYRGIEVVKNFFKTLEVRHIKPYYDNKNQLFKAFSVVGIPTHFLINSNGKIVLSFSGVTDWYDPEVRQLILSHIPGNHETPKNSSKSQNLNQSVKPNDKVEDISTEDGSKMVNDKANETK